MTNATSDHRPTTTAAADDTPSGSECQPWCMWPDVCAENRRHPLDVDAACLGESSEVPLSLRPLDDWRDDGTVEAQAVVVYAEQAPSRSAAQIHIGVNDEAGAALTPAEAVRLALALARLGADLDPALSGTPASDPAPTATGADGQPQGCPVWCNRRHAAGSDPRRQRHGRTWRATGEHSNREVRAAMSSATTGASGPAVFLDVDGLPGLASLPNGRGGVLSTADARAFALDVLFMADCADRESRS